MLDGFQAREVLQVCQIGSFVSANKKLATVVHVKSIMVDQRSVVEFSRKNGSYLHSFVLIR